MIHWQETSSNLLIFDHLCDHSTTRSIHCLWQINFCIWYFRIVVLPGFQTVPELWKSLLLIKKRAARDLMNRNNKSIHHLFLFSSRKSYRVCWRKLILQKTCFRNSNKTHKCSGNVLSKRISRKGALNCAATMLTTTAPYSLQLSHLHVINIYSSGLTLKWTWVLSCDDTSGYTINAQEYLCEYLSLHPFKSSDWCESEPSLHALLGWDQAGKSAAVLTPVQVQKHWCWNNPWWGLPAVRGCYDYQQPHFNRNFGVAVDPDDLQTHSNTDEDVHFSFQFVK